MRFFGINFNCRYIYKSILILSVSFGSVYLTGCFTNETKLLAPSKTVISDSTAQKKISPGKKPRPDTLKQPVSGLSAASKLMIRACDNYISVNPQSPKSAEVLGIKASLYYNNKLFPESRDVYLTIIDRFPGTSNASEAVRMIAQAYYEEKQFDKAQEWYRKLSDMALNGTDKQEALAHIAESIFRMAEMDEEQSKFGEAATQYERVALEFPSSKIADAALFNAGLAYEKQAEWSHSILVYQRLIQKYPESKLLAKAQFRSAKNYEKLMQWDLAAENYLRVTANFPKSELAPTALYNSGFCFENSGKLVEAAATFEKTALLFPQSEDAADVLFRAGEIYGKLKDWKSVERVNELFSSRFGNDQDRVIQALCMVGIALYMQNKESLAVGQFNKALETFSRLKNPSTMNTYYAAKAMYTIGEIQLAAMDRIQLGNPRDLYKKQLAEKSDLLDRAVETFSKVIKFNISEWTTRSIYQIGEANEEFAVGIFKQNRPQDLSIEDRLALELGIAQAVEKYFIDKALHFHEQNVKLGIKENIEDKYVLLSRKKLTYLPYVAADNYLKLVEIAKETQPKETSEGFSLIANKLKLLQKIAPFQEKAIDLFLKCLEFGSTYKEISEFYNKASQNITKISYSVGETYAEVVSIARDAPIPPSFDNYERFVYQTKLLGQIEGYEEQALTNYLKTLKIAEAYKIDDESVRNSREKIAALLFTRGRCYDLLCMSAFKNPPFPKNINEAEKEEYSARFEEIGLKFQKQAFEVYRNILKFASQNYASGEYVKHAYVRLYQNSPEEVGVKEEQIVEDVLTSGSSWKCSSDSLAGWYTVDFFDSSWVGASKVPSKLTKGVSDFQRKLPSPMWLNTESADSGTYIAPNKVFFRRTFNTDTAPREAKLYLAAKGPLSVYFNGQSIGSDTLTSMKTRFFTLTDKVRIGKNVLSIRSVSLDKTDVGLYPLLVLSISKNMALPKPPGFEKPFSIDEVKIDTYKFPFIKNFSQDESKTTETRK